MDFYSRLFAGQSSRGGSVGDELFKLVVSGNLTVITEEMLDGITSIGSTVFYRYGSLTSVDIPDSVTSIGEYAFNVCTSLTSVDIPDSVTSIGGYAFASCDSLPSVTIPNSVTSIGNFAFSNCKKLESVTMLRTTPPTLGTNAFYGTHSRLKIYVPSGSVNAYKGATNWKSYASKIYAI